MIFSDSPSQKALERMMTQVKGFPPRGSGVMVLRRFEYTAEMCDCRLCLYYNRKKKCTVSQCPCIEERIVAGAADRSEVMAETMKNIHNAAFHRRLNQFINESEELHMNFRNEKHRLAFVEAIRKLDKKNFALMSALYLLTAEHMFSVPRGYTDGFNQWCKQVAAICLTAFMQTTLLFLGLLTFPDHMLLGLGIMLAANEVPRIAQQFGLDSSVKVNMMSVVHATTTAVNLTRSVARATGK